MLRNRMQDLKDKKRKYTIQDPPGSWILDPGDPGSRIFLGSWHMSVQNVQVAWRRIKADPWQSDVWRARAHAGVYPTAWGVHRKTNSERSFCFCFSDDETTAHQLRDVLYFIKRQKQLTVFKAHRKLTPQPASPWFNTE